MYNRVAAMPRPALSFWTFTPVLTVVFAAAAIVLVLSSRPEAPPRFTTLTPVDGVLRAWSGIRATTLNLTAQGGLLTIDTGGCSGYVAELRAGDPLTVWVDKDAKAWRITRAAKPVCTFVQATAANGLARHNRRRIALGCGLLSVAAAAGMLVGQRRQRLIEGPPEA